MKAHIRVHERFSEIMSYSLGDDSPMLEVKICSPMQNRWIDLQQQIDSVRVLRLHNVHQLRIQLATSHVNVILPQNVDAIKKILYRCYSLIHCRKSLGLAIGPLWSLQCW